MAYTGLNKSLFWGVGYTVILCIIGCLAAFLSSLYSFSSFQFSRSIMSDLCDPMNRSMPGLPAHHQLLEFTQTHVHWSGMPSSHLILCRPLLLLPPNPPIIRVFSNESILRTRWPKYWSFSFISVLPTNTQD